MKGRGQQPPRILPLTHLRNYEICHLWAITCLLINSKQVIEGVIMSCSASIPFRFLLTSEELNVTLNLIFTCPLISSQVITGELKGEGEWLVTWLCPAVPNFIFITWLKLIFNETLYLSSTCPLISSQVIIGELMG